MQCCSGGAGMAAQSTSSPAQSQTKCDSHSAAEWPSHEHVSETAKVQAQRLVEELGSVGLAKHAVEAVGEVISAIPAEDRQKTFSQSLGFSSFEEVNQASAEVPANDGNHWFLTSLPDSTFAVWNDHALQADRHYSDREEALASVPHADELSGTRLLG